MRVVSLLPSATEMVCAVAGSDTLVGVSHECDYPSAVRGLPVLTSARIMTSSSSKAIDTAVRGVIRDALSIYTVDERLLGELAPDVIVTQDLCEVCAVSLDDVRRAVAKLAHRDGVQIISLQPTRLEHVWNDIVTVANALEVGPRGVDVREALSARVRRIYARASKAPRQPRVVTIEWLDPVMLGGTWMPELIALAGGTAVGVRAGEPTPTVTLGELASLSPDVVLVKPCGFDVARTLQEQPLVDAIVRSVGPNARVFVSDGNAFFNRPGPRLVESLEILAACVQPTLFPEFVEKHAAVIHHQRLP